MIRRDRLSAAPFFSECPKWLSSTNFFLIKTIVFTYFQSEGYQKGDVIALFLENCVDFPAVWVGLSKIGLITAWINTNLRAEPLAHSIIVSESKAIVTNKALFSGD